MKRYFEKVIHGKGYFSALQNDVFKFDVFEAVSILHSFVLLKHDGPYEISSVLLKIELKYDFVFKKKK